MNFIKIAFYISLAISLACCHASPTGNVRKEMTVNLKSPFSLQGKTALITGASRGLGLAFSEALAQSGARVILSARDLNKLNQAVEGLKAKGFDVLAMEMDIAEETRVNTALSLLEAKGEKIDILVNNASTGAATPIFQADPQHGFEKTIQTNLIGTWYVTKAVAQHMKLKAIHGSIINIASINGDEYPYKNQTAYAVSKAAILHMTKSLVLELAPHKIRINTISPGPTKSHLYGAPFQHDWNFWQGKIPAGFLADPSDLFGALIYLASNEASRFMTGSCITLDGGLSSRE